MSDNEDFMNRKKKQEEARKKNNSSVVRSLYSAEGKKRKVNRRSSEERKMSIAQSVSLQFFGTGTAAEVFAQSSFEDALKILYPESRYEVHYLPWLNKYSLKIN